MFGLTYLVYGKKLELFRGAVVEERIGVGIAGTAYRVPLRVQGFCVGYP